MDVVYTAFSGTKPQPILLLPRNRCEKLTSSNHINCSTGASAGEPACTHWIQQRSRQPAVEMEGVNETAGWSDTTAANLELQGTRE